jgi:hypothetical protein
MPTGPLIGRLSRGRLLEQMAIFQSCRDSACRRACLSASSGNASKMPNVVTPKRRPNHAVVGDSYSKIGRPPEGSSATSCSLPGLAFIPWPQSARLANDTLDGRSDRTGSGRNRNPVDEHARCAPHTPFGRALGDE